jgi:hypothetical protein
VPDLAHFYHCYADGGWLSPLREHIAALYAAQFPVSMRLGLVGSPANREKVRLWLDAYFADRWEMAAEAERGWEDLTVSLARQWAAEHDGYVLYAHDKGAFTPGGFESAWRFRMTQRTVCGWEECISLLQTHDVAGCHWLSPDQCWPRVWPPFPGNGNQAMTVRVGHPHFSGNFWWATTRYLRTLSDSWPFQPVHHDGCCDQVPPVVTVPRITAQEPNGRWTTELWVGSGDPVAADLWPGLPGEKENPHD